MLEPGVSSATALSWPLGASDTLVLTLLKFSLSHSCVASGSHRRILQGSVAIYVYDNLSSSFKGRLGKMVRKSTVLSQSAPWI